MAVRSQGLVGKNKVIRGLSSLGEFICVPKWVPKVDNVATPQWDPVSIRRDQTALHVSGNVAGTRITSIRQSCSVYLAPQKKVKDTSDLTILRCRPLECIPYC